MGISEEIPVSCILVNSEIMNVRFSIPKFIKSRSKSMLHSFLLGNDSWSISHEELKLHIGNFSNSKNLHLKNPNRQSHRNNQKFIELILN